jgi:hypothetical protein
VPDTQAVRSETRRLGLAGALYALPLAVDALSERLAEALYEAGLFGLPIAAAVIQIYAARRALQEASARVARPVMRATAAFFCGAAVVLFLVLLPLADVLGTFDGLAGTGLTGGMFFVYFAVVFALAMLITAGVVIAAASATRAIRRRRASPRSTAG